MSLDDAAEYVVPVVIPNRELYAMPLSAIRYETYDEICQGLSATVIKLVDTRIKANTKGLIEYLGFNENQEIISCPAPFAPLIDAWQALPYHRHPPSAGKLIEILHTFERYDILFEITPLIQTDLKNWQDKVRRMREYEESKFTKLPKPVPDPIELKSVKSIDPISSQDDCYDAMFSYDAKNEYSKYIMEDMFNCLTRTYRLKLFKNVGASELERRQTFRMISKNCSHVILLLSESYLESTECQADLNFMTNTDLMAFERKIIPVLIENVKMPDLLMDRVPVRYFRKDEKMKCLQSINHVILTQRKARR